MTAPPAMSGIRSADRARSAAASPPPGPTAGGRGWRAMSRRRRVRVVLLALATPVAIVGLLLAAKLVSLPVIAGGAIDAYRDGAYEQSVTQTEGLFGWNAFEPWVAHFDRGTARAGAGLYNEAIVDLERAFEIAPDERRCDVAVNLSLSWERLGDAYVAQGEFAGAKRLYATAAAVIASAGTDCPEAEQTAEGRDPGEELTEAEARLEAKSQDAEQQGAEQDQAGSAAEGAGQTPLERLAEQNQAAAAEKAQQEAEDRARSGGGQFTERPW